MHKKILRKSFILPVVVGVFMIGSTASALVATNIIGSKPAQSVEVTKPVAASKTSPASSTDAEDARTAAANDVAEVRTNADGTKTYVLRSALDKNGQFNAPDADGCWNFTMTGYSLPSEVRRVCNQSDIDAFMADYRARDAAVPKPYTPSPQTSTPTANSVPAPTMQNPTSGIPEPDVTPPSTNQ